MTLIYLVYFPLYPLSMFSNKSILLQFNTIYIFSAVQQAWLWLPYGLWARLPFISFVDFNSPWCISHMLPWENILNEFSITSAAIMYSLLSERWWHTTKREAIYFQRLCLFLIQMYICGCLHPICQGEKVWAFFSPERNAIALSINRLRSKQRK